MTNLKKGDRIKLSTGIEGVVDRVDGHGSFGVDFDGYGYYNSRDLYALNISWEVIKPVLVEPPAGSVIRFRDRVAVREPYEGIDFHWGVKDDPAVYSWQGLVHEYNITEFEVLRPEKEVVKEILEILYAEEAPEVLVWHISRMYGVVL